MNGGFKHLDFHPRAGHQKTFECPRYRPRPTAAGCSSTMRTLAFSERWPTATSGVFQVDINSTTTFRLAHSAAVGANSARTAALHSAKSMAPAVFIQFPLKLITHLF